MVHNVPLEKFDANMEEATVGGWHVTEGETIAEGQPLLEIITDKATFDYESPVAGTVRRLVIPAGSVVPVLTVLCQIGDPDEPLPEVAEQNRQLLAEYRARQEVTIQTGGRDPQREARSGGRVRATPAARRLAKEHGLDLADVPTAEPGGVVTEEDVRAHLR